MKTATTITPNVTENQKISLRSMVIAVLLYQMINGHEAMAQPLAEGWKISGSNPQAYQVFIDEQQYSPSIRSHDSANSKQFIAVFETLGAQMFRSKHLTLTVKMRSQDLDAWAGALLRIDDQYDNTLAFDNMYKKPIKGTTAWQEYSIVMGVPAQAHRIYYGVLMSGQGQLWFRNFALSALPIPPDTTDFRTDKQYKQTDPYDQPTWK